MDYEKKYKESLERAKEQLDKAKVFDYKEEQIAHDIRTTAYAIFPELKESEDERIRKIIKTSLKSYFDGRLSEGTNDTDYAICLTWLEKQGGITKLSEEEQNRFAKGVLTSCALSFIDYLDANKYEGKMCVSNGECEDIENAFHNAMWDRLYRYYCKYIDKQCEQKSADKVEPKFHEGDKIQYLKGCGTIMTIEKIEDGEYIFADNMGHTTIESGNKWHLVECNPAWSEEDEQMLAEIVKDLQVYKSRDISRAVKDAYQNEIDWLKSLKDKVQPQLKQEWSEEDEKKVNGIITILKPLHETECDYNKYKNSLIAWLKSIRPQNVWISVDEEVYVKEPVLAQKKDKSEPFKGYVVCCDHTLVPNVYERYMILGNIVSQNTWKPSDEQMEALRLSTYCQDKKMSKVLFGLYQDLKKLKEG